MSGLLTDCVEQDDEQLPASSFPGLAIHGAPNFYPVLHPFDNSLGNLGRSVNMLQQLQSTHAPFHKGQQTLLDRHLQPPQLEQFQIPQFGPFQPILTGLSGSGLPQPFWSHQSFPRGVPVQQWQNSGQDAGIQQEHYYPAEHIFDGAGEMQQNQGHPQEWEHQQQQGSQLQNSAYLPDAYVDTSFNRMNTSSNNASSVTGYDAASGDLSGSSMLSSKLQTNSLQTPSYPTSISSYRAPSKLGNDPTHCFESLQAPSNQLPDHVSSSLSHAAGCGYLQGASSDTPAADLPASRLALDINTQAKESRGGDNISETGQKRKRKGKGSETAVLHQNIAQTLSSCIVDAPAQTIIWSAPVNTSALLHDYMELQEDLPGTCHWPEGDKLQTLARLVNGTAEDIQSFVEEHRLFGSLCSCPDMDNALKHTTHSNPQYTLLICRREDVNKVKDFIKLCKTKSRQNKSQRNESVKSSDGYPCPEPGCLLLFADCPTWRRHMEFRYPVAFHLCLQCKDGCIWGRNIGEHMRDKHKIEGGEARWKPHTRRIEYDPPMDFRCPRPNCPERFEGMRRAVALEQMLQHYWDVHMLRIRQAMDSKKSPHSRRSSSGPRRGHGQGSPPGRSDHEKHSDGPGLHGNVHSSSRMGSGQYDRSYHADSGSRYCIESQQQPSAMDIPRGRARSRAGSTISSSQPQPTHRDSTATKDDSIDEESLRFVAQQETSVDGAIATTDPFSIVRSISTDGRPSDDDSSDPSTYDRSLETSTVSLATSATEHSPGPSKRRTTTTEVLSSSEVGPASIYTSGFSAVQEPQYAHLMISKAVLMRHERRLTIPLIRTAFGRSSKAPCTRLSSSLPRMGTDGPSSARLAFRLPLRGRSRFTTHSSEALVKGKHGAHSRSTPPRTGRSDLVLCFADGLTLVHYSQRGRAAFWSNSSNPEWLDDLISEHTQRRTCIHVNYASGKATVVTEKTDVSAQCRSLEPELIT